MDNGYWGYRYAIVIGGKRKEAKKVRNDEGQPFKTAKQASKARESAYMLGKYCGLRIDECYGLKWSNVDLKSGIITIDRQMQYQEGLIKLVSLKTRNAKRKINMCSKVKDYFKKLKRQQEKDKKQLDLQRQQNQTFIQDLKGDMISSLELVNSLSNGKYRLLIP